MAKTLKKMVESVIEQASGFNVTDDNEYPELLVEDILVSVNNSLIREAFRNRTLDQTSYMRHENIEIKELSNDIIVEGISIANKSHLLYADIPNLVSGVGDKNLLYLGPVDYSESFSRKRFEKLINQRGIVYRLGNISFSIVGNQIFFLETEVMGINIISTIGLFSDPRVVSSYNEDEPFPTPSDYKMELLALQQLLQSKNIPYDIVNDGQRMIVQPRQKQEAK
jgi:hypothetical protein